MGINLIMIYLFLIFLLYCYSKESNVILWILIAHLGRYYYFLCWYLRNILHLHLRDCTFWICIVMYIVLLLTKRCFIHHLQIRFWREIMISLYLNIIIQNLTQEKFKSIIFILKHSMKPNPMLFQRAPQRCIENCKMLGYCYICCTCGMWYLVI